MRESDLHEERMDCYQFGTVPMTDKAMTAVELMEAFYLSDSYDPKAARPADTVTAAIQFTLSRQSVGVEERERCASIVQANADWNFKRHREEAILGHDRLSGTYFAVHSVLTVMADDIRSGTTLDKTNGRLRDMDSY